MQLPRGTFREIKKGSLIGDLLRELERSKFSGICSISSAAGTGTLVYKKGVCILVKYLGKSGDTGWDELLAVPDSEVDAALSTLDDAQLQLSLEFNKPCRLVRAVRPTAESAKKAPPPPRETVKKPVPPARPAASPVMPPHKPAAAASLFHRPAAAAEPPAAPSPAPVRPAATAPAPRRPSMPAPPVMPRPPSETGGAGEHRTGEETPDASGGSSSFEKDIDTFDTMDLDNVTDKIRNDCKTMIKQLHLEHLMER